MSRVQKLTPFAYSEGTDWRFRLESDMSIVVVGRDFGRHQFCDQDGVLRMSMDGHTITVYASYSWDGSSPKFRLFGQWMGTPDFKGTRLAGMVHDTLYQFLHLPCFPLTRQQCDGVFGAIMASEGFPLWWLYSGAVWTFGGLHSRILGGPRSGKCLVHV